MPSLYKVSFLFAAMLAGVLAVHDEAGYCSNASGTGPTICSYVYFIGVCFPVFLYCYILLLDPFVALFKRAITNKIKQDTSDYEIYAFPIPGVAKVSLYLVLFTFYKYVTLKC